MRLYSSEIIPRQFLQLQLHFLSPYLFGLSPQTVIDRLIGHRSGGGVLVPVSHADRGGEREASSRVKRGVSWPPVTDSLPAVEEEAAAAAAGGGAPAELVREEEALSPRWVGLERVLAAVASLCWLTTEGWRRRAPGTGAWPVWKV